MAKLEMLFVGIDAASFALIGPWIEAGRLPHLKSLMDRGCSGTLVSSMPPLSSVAWPSLYTGANPGKHGIYDFVERSPAGRGVRFLNRSHCQATPIWQLANRAGKSVGVINMPMSYPPDPVDGFMVSGLDTPSLKSQYTHPAALREEIQREVGEYVIELEHNPRLMNDPERYVQMMLETVAIRERTAHHLLSRHPVELLMVVFTATDRVQHSYWKYLDPAHPESRPGLRDAILRVYERVDAALGTLVERAGPDADVVVASDHGMAPVTTSVDLNRWLRANGFLRLTQGALAARASDFLRRVRRRLLKKTEVIWFDDFVDWGRTQAYHVGAWGNIYLNVRGRDPQGCVEPGAEYEAVRNRIAQGLLALRDPANGRPVISAVRTREELYHGEQMRSAPDLVLLWHEPYNCVKSLQENIRRSRGLFQPSTIICGDHAPEGLFVLSSPRVRPGLRGQRAQITDIAPTMLHLLGLEVPAWMDGRVLEGFLAEQFTRDRPVRYGDAGAADASGELAYSDEDAEKVAERLRNLGYLE